MTPWMFSNTTLSNVTRNIGTLLLNNQKQVGNLPVFAERTTSPLLRSHREFAQTSLAHSPLIGSATNSEIPYYSWSWYDMVQHVLSFAIFLQRQRLEPGQRVAFVTANSYRRLVAELAVMASGLTTVPIFMGYPDPLLRQLMTFSQVNMAVIENARQLQRFSSDDLPEHIVLLHHPETTDDAPIESGQMGTSQIRFFDDIFSSEDTPSPEYAPMIEQMKRVDPHDITLIMYTSGTTNFPKGVQLTHHNILSQQQSLSQLWNPQPGMQFLSYLPWHHSFGGLFERFLALHSGGCLALDDSFGKNIPRLLDNFALVRPQIYLSVPKIYQEIVAHVLASPEAERAFFHPELRFVFTAAAPLPLSISNVFKAKKVPVVEGWGLTETSPCCTLTAPSLQREVGVVGYPLPDVSIKLSDDGEILVKGPNVMRGYFRDSVNTNLVLDDQGWLKTGDIGEITPYGLRIMSRKDRVFKLSNGEKVYPSVLEDRIATRCRWIKHAYVFGTGQSAPSALLFPNFDMMKTQVFVDEGFHCSHPCHISHLSHCLGPCLQELNDIWETKFERIQKAVVINRELSLEKNELTPSFKMIPRAVESNYRCYIDCFLSNEWDNLPADACLVHLGKQGGQA